MNLFAALSEMPNKYFERLLPKLNSISFVATGHLSQNFYKQKLNGHSKVLVYKQSLHKAYISAYIRSLRRWASISRKMSGKKVFVKNGANTMSLEWRESMSQFWTYRLYQQWGQPSLWNFTFPVAIPNVITSQLNVPLLCFNLDSDDCMKTHQRAELVSFGEIIRLLSSKQTLACGNDRYWLVQPTLESPWRG